MAKRTRELDAPSGGMSLSTRFTLFMTTALAAVMVVAGFALYTMVAQVTSNLQENSLIDAVRLTGANQTAAMEMRRLSTERDLLLSVNRRIA
ncbi:MAG: hypothetical protein ABI054_14055, partial [Planctomycetota bacterium]